MYAPLALSRITVASYLYEKTYHSCYDATVKETDGYQKTRMTTEAPEVIEAHAPGYLLSNGELQLRFHPGQTKAWLSEAEIIAVLASTQGGKTSFGPYWLQREIETRGPGDYLAVTATFPLLNLKMQPEFLHLFRDWFNLGVWRAADRVFEILSWLSNTLL